MRSENSCLSKRKDDQHQKQLKYNIYYYLKCTYFGGY